MKFLRMRNGRLFSEHPAGIRLAIATIIFLSCAVLLEATGAAAEPSAPATGAATTASAGQSTTELQALVATLQDDAARRKLIAQIQALIALRQSAPPNHVAPAASPPPDAADSPGVQAIAVTSSQIRRVSDALVTGAATFLDAPAFIEWIGRQAGNPATRLGWLYAALQFVSIIALAVLAERIAVLLLQRPRHSIRDREGASAWLRFALMLARFAVDIFQLAIFGATAYLALFLINPGDFARISALAFVNANILVRAILASARAMLGTETSTFRPLRMRDETAGYWFVWLRRFVWLTVYGYALADSALLLGLPGAAYEILAKIIGTSIAILLVILILQNRTLTASWIRGTPKEGGSQGLYVLRSRFADIWHVLALLYVIAIFGIWALQIPGGFAFIARASFVSVVLLLLAKAAAGGGGSMLRSFFSIGRDLKLRFPGLQKRADRYLPILVVSLHCVLYVGAAIFICEAWGLGAFDWMRSDLGRQIIGDLATILVTTIVAAAIWEGASLLFEYYLYRQAGEDKAPVRPGRLRTLLPLIRRAIAIVLIIFVVLIALSELGVNIAPLLAGAGVIGIAVGFGAQGFVKDLITGLNLLLEDTFGVGDVVTIGADSGVVEVITMRTMRLRDGAGALHTIPFGEVTKVTNSSRDYGNAIFNIPVGFGEDFDTVVDALNAVGVEMRKDPAIAWAIAGPLQPPVLDRFADYAMIVQTQIRTLPGRQTDVAREFNRRLKERFDELGIEMPYPSRRLYVVGSNGPGGPAAAPRR